MTTEYRVTLDRETCEGIFACLVRDDRFVEGADGLATVDGENGDTGRVVVAFADDRLDDARRAARACPVGAIDVTEVADE